MTHPSYTDQFLRQRRLYLILPLISLPFLTFIYWKLVVSNLAKQGQQNQQGTGLKLNLPSAALKGELSMDKLAYYRKADQDSANWAKQIKKDPYRQGQQPPASDSIHSALMGLSAPGPKRKGLDGFKANTIAHSRQENQVHQRIRQLNKALSEAQTPSFENQDLIVNESAQIHKLEEMMAGMQTQDTAQDQDPEMAELDGMLDKLLALQDHQSGKSGPGGISQADQNPALLVSPAPSDDQVSLLTAEADSTGSHFLQSGPPAFYGLDQDTDTASKAGLTAVIEQNQQLISGSTVQLRLTSPLSVAGVQIPENTLLHGLASLSGERLKIKIRSVKSGNRVFPVSLSVYDLDGLEGIYVPGTLSRTVAKQQLASQLQGYDLDAGGPSVGTQAASAGIQMGKILLSRKTRLAQITLTAGYKVLLVQTNTIQP